MLNRAAAVCPTKPPSPPSTRPIPLDDRDRAHGRARGADELEGGNDEQELHSTECTKLFEHQVLDKSDAMALDEMAVHGQPILQRVEVLVHQAVGPGDGNLPVGEPAGAIDVRPGQPVTLADVADRVVPERTP